MANFKITIRENNGVFEATYGNTTFGIGNPHNVNEANRAAVCVKVDSNGHLDFAQQPISSIGTRTVLKFRYPLQEPVSFKVAKNEKLVIFTHPDDKKELHGDDYVLQLIGSEDFRDARAGWTVPHSFLVEKKQVAISVESNGSNGHKLLVIDTELVAA